MSGTFILRPSTKISMGFNYTSEFIGTGFTYEGYRKSIEDALAAPPTDEHAQKMHPYIAKNARLMNGYDQTSVVSENVKIALKAAPATTWLVITEGWCGDAAFNIPTMAAIEKQFPEKIKLRFFLRDSNLELIDANLTDGGRSIPKLVVLNDEWADVGNWGPRPEGLQILMKEWKSAGLELKELIPKVHAWYDTDATLSLQQELVAMIKSYS